MPPTANRQPSTDPHSVWIKVCGLTSEDAVAAAVAAGVDAIGFVFAPSKRQVTPQRAAKLARHVPAHIMRVAVMLHPSQTLVDEVCAVFQPHIVQSDAEDFAALRLPANVDVLPVIRGLVSASGSSPEERPARILFEGPVSGAGETSDWTLATQLARNAELVLAGGLTPANVREAIARVRPFGVDVSSGVEVAPGIKSVEKIVAFVQAARSARFGSSH